MTPFDEAAHNNKQNNNKKAETYLENWFQYLSVEEGLKDAFLSALYTTFYPLIYIFLNIIIYSKLIFFVCRISWFLEHNLNTTSSVGLLGLFPFWRTIRLLIP